MSLIILYAKMNQLIIYMLHHNLKTRKFKLLYYLVLQYYNPQKQTPLKQRQAENATVNFSVIKDHIQTPGLFKKLTFFSVDMYVGKIPINMQLYEVSKHIYRVYVALKASTHINFTYSSLQKTRSFERTRTF